MNAGRSVEGVPCRDAIHGIAGSAHARRDSAGVGPDRLHRVRRAAGARRAVPRAVRNTTGMAYRCPVRACARGDQHPARTGLDTARDLLRLAATRIQRSTRRRPWLHPARPRADLRALRSVPCGLAAYMDNGAPGWEPVPPSRPSRSGPGWELLSRSGDAPRTPSGCVGWLLGTESDNHARADLDRLLNPAA
jgi:hypothetical protein